MTAEEILKLMLFLILLLHRTTTSAPRSDAAQGCSLFSFYIEPQRLSCSVCSRRVVPYSPSTSNHNLAAHGVGEGVVVPYSPSTSNHNVREADRPLGVVVPYSPSTSNHNLAPRDVPAGVLFLILLLHRTTTHYPRGRLMATLFLILLLHRTTTRPRNHGGHRRCSLFSFYIEPQPPLDNHLIFIVLPRKTQTKKAFSEQK